MGEDDIESKLAELKAKYKVLSDSEELYRTAMGLTTHTVTLVDIPKKSLCQIFNEGSWSGVETTMTDAPESIIKTGIIYPDDEDPYREFYKEIYAGVPKTECPIRVLGENGHWYWFTMYAETIFDENGEPKYAVCFSDDLTARHEAELLYQQFTDIIISQSEFFWEVNLSKDIMMRSNDKSTAMIKPGKGNTYEEIHKLGLANVVYEDRTRFEQKFSRAALLRQFNEGRREVRMTYRYAPRESVKPEWMESVVYLMMNGESDITAMITSKVVEGEKQKELKLEERAELDPLCGLMNRAAWEKAVREDMALKGGGVLFLIDADDFKNINDRYGHIYGDKALISIAQAIKQSFRRSDLIARFGGDEFVVYMRGEFTETVIKSCASALIKKIKTIHMDINSHLSVSIGIVSREGQEDLTSMYEKVDKKLYAAKNNGKGVYEL